MTVFVFPGQGSQKLGMGASLFETFPDMIAIADKVLGYSIQELCLEDPKGKLNQTDYTQPALFVVEAMAYQESLTAQSKPDYLAGHSLGEYTALYAADSFDFETGCRLVQKRGELMAQQTNGGMLAVIGGEFDFLKDALSKEPFADIDIANINTPQQVVLSGPKEDLTRFADDMGQHFKKCVPLNVSAAFHSRYMQTAAKAFEDFLGDIEFKTPSIPVIANTTAKPYEPSNLKKTLAAQIAHSVQWVDSIRYLKALGETEFVEIGPGKVLTGLVRKI
jgi:malonyl CoA-acyl carrier protein transacylase